jgi:hypothetical protein
MTVDEILAELDDHGFVDTSTLRKLSKLNQVYRSVCARMNWPFLQASATLNFSGSATPTNMPTDVKVVRGLTVPSTGYGLSHRRLDSIRSRDLTLTGDPIHFYFNGNQLSVYPVPSSGSTLTLDYTKRPAVLASGGSEASILIPSSHHGLLVDGTLYKLYIMEDDPELASFFRDEFRDRLVELHGELQTQTVTPDAIHMTDPEDYDYYNTELY